MLRIGRGALWRARVNGGALSTRVLHVLAYWCLLAGAYVAIARRGWSAGWQALGVPAMPTFADSRPIQAALARQLLSTSEIARRGLNDPWNRPFNYPDVWLDIGRLLHLTDERCYLASMHGMVVIFVAACTALLWFRPSLLTLLFLCSFPFALVVERGNNEMLVFALVLVGALARPAWVTSASIFTASVLKVFPLFALPALLRRPRWLLATGLAASAYWTLHHAQLWRIRAATPDSPSVSYGLSSAALAMHFKLGLSVERARLVVGIITLAACALALWHRPRRMPIEAHPHDRELAMFLSGAGIYVCSFVLASNWDYRLIFLVLCFPYLLRCLPAMGARALAFGCVFAAAHQLWLMTVLGRALGGGINVMAKLLLFVGLASMLGWIVTSPWRSTAQLTQGPARDQPARESRDS